MVFLTTVTVLAHALSPCSRRVPLRVVQLPHHPGAIQFESECVYRTGVRVHYYRAVQKLLRYCTRHYPMLPGAGCVIVLVDQIGKSVRDNLEKNSEL